MPTQPVNQSAQNYQITDYDNSGWNRAAPPALKVPGPNIVIDPPMIKVTQLETSSKQQAAMSCSGRSEGVGMRICPAAPLIGLIFIPPPFRMPH